MEYEPSFSKLILTIEVVEGSVVFKDDTLSCLTKWVWQSGLR